MKCLVKNCQNREGKGCGFQINIESMDRTEWLCLSCWWFVKEGEGVYSQVYRNAHEKPGPKNLSDLTGHIAVACFGHYGIAYHEGYFYAVDRGFSNPPVTHTFKNKIKAVEWLATTKPAFWETLLMSLMAWEPTP